MKNYYNVEVNPTADALNKWEVHFSTKSLKKAREEKKAFIASNERYGYTDKSARLVKCEVVS